MAPEGQPADRLRVLVADEAGRRLSLPGVTRWLTRVAPTRARGVVGVAIVSDRRLRDLNREYRHKDYATDVLSFGGGEASDLAVGPTAGQRSGVGFRSGATRRLSSASPLFLGEIVIARGVARRQAREAGHSELTELRVLALHGLFHLLGYDHARDNGRMARTERSLRVKGGLREGLIERAAVRRRAGVSGEAK